MATLANLILTIKINMQHYHKIAGCFLPSIRAANNFFYLERTYVRPGHHFGRTKGKFGRT